MSGTLAEKWGKLTCEWCGAKDATRMPAFCGQAGGILCSECRQGPFVPCPANHAEYGRCPLCRGLGVVKEAGA